MINYIIYSHTDYIDILNIQTHYLKFYENKILLINKSDIDLSEIYNEYKKVIFYDDQLPYASRLLYLLELNLDYILFIHDIDIVVFKDDDYIEFLLKKMIEDNIDRIDLQFQDKIYNNDTDDILISKDKEEFYLNRQLNVQHYIYNVNPSIWKLSSFMEIISNFKNQLYRNIENTNIQTFCTKYKIYKLYGDRYIRCGYFTCLPFFQFLHITHGGKFLPISNNRLDDHLDIEYKKIVNNFLIGNKRQFFDKDMW